MSTQTGDGRARGILVLMMCAGIGLTAIPFFLTPPAYLDLALRDKVFGADLTGGRVVVTHDLTGRSMNVAVEKAGNAFLARLGRIDSGDGTFSVLLDGYKRRSVKVAAAPLQNVRAPVDLTPTFGRLEITPVNAVREGEQVAATATEAGRVLVAEPRRTIVVNLPPGKHRIAASADGFCTAEREFIVREGEVTREQFPLSPDLMQDEIARFVLGWPNDPADLDSHLRRVGTAGNRNPQHLHFMRKEARTAAGALLATLDVDRRQPRGYETVTVRSSAVGDFDYWVHLWSGHGTLGGSDATVTVYTRGCQMRTFTVPPDCAETIWNVTTLRNRGTVELIERNRCEQGRSLSFGGKAPIAVGPPS